MRQDSSLFVVAVIDDDARVLESLENLLQSAGHVVRTFGSAEAFLEHGDLADVDCLISDIGMPRIDGFELQRRLSATHPDLPVILLTGRHELAPPTSGMSQSCDRFFRKPFDGRDLLTAVRKVLPGSRRDS